MRRSQLGKNNHLFALLSHPVDYEHSKGNVQNGILSELIPGCRSFAGSQRRDPDR